MFEKVNTYHEIKSSLAKNTKYKQKMKYCKNELSIFAAES